ncbi:MAG: hypothetical protein ACLQOO_29045 [Terriglobia bacterium]
MRSVKRDLNVGELKPGMIFADDVNSGKRLLIARGQEVTSSLMERLQNFDSEVGVRQPLRAPALTVSAMK